MKYKLVNKTTKEEAVCTKVNVDGFDYYVSNDEIKLNDTITDNYRIWFWRDDCSLLGRKKVIATNNLNIDIPKVIDEVEELAENLSKIRRNIHSYTEEYCEGIKDGFEEGYNKHKETNYFSEEDMLSFSMFYYKSFGKIPIDKILDIWKEQKAETIYYQ